MIIWQLDYYYAALPVQIFLIVFYLMRRRLPLREWKSFLVLMELNLLSIISDIGASLISMGDYPVPLQYGCNIFYFTAIILLGYGFWRYIRDTVYEESHWNIWLHRFVLLCNGLSAAVIWLTPWTGSVFSIDPAIGYRDGPLYPLVYVCCIIDMLAAFAVLLAARSSYRLVKKLEMGLRFSVLFIIAGILFSWIYREILLVCLFTTLAVLTAYLSIRNPDLYIDRKTGFFNSQTLHLFLKDRMRKEPFYAFGFSIKNFRTVSLLYGNKFSDQILEALVHFLSGHSSGTWIFYLRDGRFLIFGKTEERMTQAAAEIVERFHKPWMIAGNRAMLDMNCLYLDHRLAPESAEKLEQVFDFGFEDIEDRELEPLVLDENYIKQGERKIRLYKDLERSVNEGTLRVSLAPVVESRSRRLLGAEAVTAIKGEDGIWIPSDQWMDMADRYGQSIPLGRQIFFMVCNFLRNRGVEAGSPDWILVNLTPGQCVDDGTLSDFENIRNACHVPTSRIRIGFTEQGILTDKGLKQLQKFHESGYTLVLDNFGSGYSYMARLRQLPVACVHMGNALVRDYFHHPDTYLPNLIETCHDMGCRTMAGSVETEEMARALTHMGFDEMEGPFFSLPLSMGRFMEVYGEEKKRK